MLRGSNTIELHIEAVGSQGKLRPPWKPVFDFLRDYIFFFSPFPVIARPKATMFFLTAPAHKSTSSETSYQRPVFLYARNQSVFFRLWPLLRGGRLRVRGLKLMGY